MSLRGSVRTRPGASELEIAHMLDNEPEATNSAPENGTETGDVTNAGIAQDAPEEAAPPRRTRRRAATTTRAATAAEPADGAADQPVGEPDAGAAPARTTR